MGKPTPSEAQELVGEVEGEVANKEVQVPMAFSSFCPQQGFLRPAPNEGPGSSLTPEPMVTEADPRVPLCCGF